MTTRTYPARIRGELDPQLSRWKWLVKWVLLIPHFVVLFFLWIAAFFVTVGAGFAILFTGRYPRAMFDFTVGVMRWSWRVSFYGIDAFGTDRYPPFSLRPDDSYPADLTVDYPQHLSRGLVLVKWWLLAIPHYVIVSVFVGGWAAGWNNDKLAVSLGLTGVLAVIAMVIVLFNGSYPRSIFDLVMGFNRWCFRVCAYAALMTDVYPPFRLDMGGPDPSGTPARPHPQPHPSGSGPVQLAKQP